MNAAPQRRRHVKVGVGYGWTGDVRNDPRWKQLRPYLESVAKAARSRALAAPRSVSFDDESDDGGGQRPDDLPEVRVRRLRATAGQMMWESIVEHIETSDVLVFDVTPTKDPKDDEGSRKMVANNVWLELGYALAKCPRSVFVIAADKDAYTQLPSDLQGLTMGHLPEDAKATDLSLRMALSHAIARSLLEVARLLGSPTAPGEATVATPTLKRGAGKGAGPRHR